MIATELSLVRHGPACNDHRSRQGAGIGGPDKPGHDEWGQLRSHEPLCTLSNAKKS
jgi:hypothetical protein